jgi:anti-sigma28 factor (negative regulator of flagellin synthesis)
LAKDVAIMSEISNIGITNSYSTAYRPLYTGPNAPMQQSDQGNLIGESDPVEFSRMGRMLAGASDTSSLRLAKIQSLRAEIADGTFETHERIEGTVNRLIQILE